MPKSTRHDAEHEARQQLAAEHVYDAKVEGALEEVDVLSLDDEEITLTRSGDVWTGSKTITTEDTVRLIYACRGIPGTKWKLTITREDDKKTPALSGKTLVSGNDAGKSNRNRDIKFS